MWRLLTNQVPCGRGTDKVGTGAGVSACRGRAKRKGRGKAERGRV